MLNYFLWKLWKAQQLVRTSIEGCQQLLKDISWDKLIGVGTDESPNLTDKNPRPSKMIEGNNMKRFLIRTGFLIVLFAIRYIVELFKCGPCDKHSCETWMSAVHIPVTGFRCWTYWCGLSALLQCFITELKYSPKESVGRTIDLGHGSLRRSVPTTEGRKLENSRTILRWHFLDT
jgi:hypothetical protein